jgi:hypothetical protein
MIARGVTSSELYVARGTNPPLVLNRILGKFEHRTPRRRWKTIGIGLIGLVLAGLHPSLTGDLAHAQNVQALAQQRVGQAVYQVSRECGGASYQVLAPQSSAFTRTYTEWYTTYSAGLADPQQRDQMAYQQVYEGMRQFAWIAGACPNLPFGGRQP